MTNEELKKKIMEVIDNSVDDWATRDKRGRIHVHIEKIADALIDANIFVDIDTLKDEQQSMNGILTSMSSYMKYKLHELKHRAEVAERALGNACEDVKEVVSFLIELSERVDGLRVEGYLPEESEPKAYINRAEKELAEEGDDDSRGNDEGE